MLIRFFNHWQKSVVQTSEDKDVAILLQICLVDYMLKNSFLLLFISKSARNLLQPDEALQNTVVVILVL